VTRTQHYMNNQPVPMQLGALPDLELGALPKGKKGKKGKGDGKGKAKNKKGDKSKKAGDGDKDRVCYYCQKVGHQKADCKKRISDLAKAEGKPVGALLQEDDYLLALPLEEESIGPQGRSDFERPRRRIVGSHRHRRRLHRGRSARCARRGTGQRTHRRGAALLAAQPQQSASKKSNGEYFLMIDTCAGASVFPKNFDKRAIKDDTVPRTTLRTATNGAVTMTGGRRSTFTLQNGTTVAVKYNESNVSFPIVSVGEATVQGNWFVFGPGGQAMIGPDAGAVLEELVTSKAAVQLQKSRGVYWLPCKTASGQAGAAMPLCAVRREAEAKEAPLAAEDGVMRGIAQGSAAPAATQGSAAEAAAQPSRPGSSDDHLKLDESEESRKPNVKRLPPQVAQEEVDRHNVTHLPFRSWCQHCVRGKATDDHHKRLAHTSVAGEAKWGMDTSS
jgi:hypothetical protein